MAAIINPQQSSSVVAPLSCCDLDPQSRDALIVYYLTLILKKDGGADFTTCPLFFATFNQNVFKKYTDEQHAYNTIFTQLHGIMLHEGVTIPTVAEAMAASACYKNGTPCWGLDISKQILWNFIVSALI